MSTSSQLKPIASWTDALYGKQAFLLAKKLASPELKQLVDEVLSNYHFFNMMVVNMLSRSDEDMDFSRVHALRTQTEDRATSEREEAQEAVGHWLKEKKISSLDNISRPVE